MTAGEFKSARKARGLVTPRPRRWAERYGLDPAPSPRKLAKANLHRYSVDSWDEACAILIQHQCIGDIDGDFDCEEDEELCANQHEEAKAHFNKYGYYECSVDGSLSSVLVDRG
jgi:hypothetical protein